MQQQFDFLEWDRCSCKQSRSTENNASVTVLELDLVVFALLQ